MSQALMHRCIDQPNLPCPGCEADCAEETEILAEISAGQDQEYFEKHCPKHKDHWRDDGSCPQCEQEEAEDIRSGNWFGITCAIMLFCLPAFGQAAYSGLGLYSGSATYNSSSCAAPNFCAYNGVDLIPWGTVPDFGGLTNSGATAYDTSFLGHLEGDGVTTFANSAFLSPITRVTDAFSVPGRNYRTLNAGMGGSGMFTLTNKNTTLIRIGDNTFGRVCFFSPSGANKGHCLAAADYPGTNKPASGIFVTTNMCTAGGTACPASSATTPADFGSLSFSLTDPAVLYTFGSNANLSSETAVTPYTFDITAGTYSIGSPIADFIYGLPLGSNAPAWATGQSYAYGAYVTHALTAAEMKNSGVWQAGFNYLPGDIIDAGAPNHCMYNVTTISGSGTSGGSSPAFINASACDTDTLADNQVTWRGTYSTPQFVYQNTGAAGTSKPTTFQWLAPGALNLDDTLTGWSLCYIGSCGGGTPGGTGTPTSVSQTIGNASPSLDGGSMALSFIAPSTSGTTNLLATYKAGANDAATSLSFDGYFYVPTNASLVSQFEFDQFIFSATDNIEYMFGSQCNKTAGFWQVWNQLSGTWASTSVACSLTAGTWYEIAETAHRVAGDTSCSGEPCLHYDSLTINGVAQSGYATTEPAGPLPGGWTSNTGFQFQMNAASAGSSGAAIVEYVDALTFSATPSTLGSDGAMSKTTSPQQLTMSTSHPFTATWVGQTISVSGAGASGATLYTTILSYTSSSVVTLALPALTTVSGATVALTGHPDTLSSTVGDASPIVWTNVGTNYVPTKNQSWSALGGISRDTAYPGASWASKYGTALSTNTYGIAPKYVANATQDTGFWLVVYDAILNIYHLLNTATGIWTDWSCTGGSGYNCSGGTWTPATVGTMKAIVDPFGTGQKCPNSIHNFKMSSNGLYGLITHSDTPPYSQCLPLGYPNFDLWQTATANFDPYKSLQVTYGALPHYGIGANKMVGANGSAWGYTAGVFLSVYTNLESVQGNLTGNPVDGGGNPPAFSVYLKPLATQSTPQSTPPGCYVTVGSTIKNPDCNLSEGLGNHVSWVGDPGTDTYPACGAVYNSATLSPIAPFQWINMIACYQTFPTYPTNYDGESTPPSLSTAMTQSVGNVWQFSHTFNIGNNVVWSTQFGISQYSQDANWMFWSSDWNCQNGSTLSGGSAPTVYSGSGTYYQMLAVTPVPASPSSLCGLPWQPATAYVVGNLIDPVEGTGGSSAVDDVFQAIYVNGLSGPASNLGGKQPKCGSTSCFANTNPPTIAPVAVTAATESSTAGTVTVGTALTLNTGVFVTLAGMTPSGYNGTWPVSSSSGTSTTFTVTGLPTGLGTATGFGTATTQGDTVCDSTSGSANSIDPSLPYSSSCPNGVVWQDLSPQTQRGDVFAVKLGLN